MFAGEKLGLRVQMDVLLSRMRLKQFSAKLVSLSASRDIQCRHERVFAGCAGQ